MVPKPVEAVLFVFPITKEIDEIRKSEDERVQKDGQPHLDPTLFYIKQTVSGILHSRNKISSKRVCMTSKIPNACGTIALLHSIYNVSGSCWYVNHSLRVLPVSATSRAYECSAKVPGGRNR